MMLLREDRALEGENEGYLALSPIARAEMTLSIAHQAGRKNDPLIQAFLDAARGPWPDLKLAEAPVAKRDLERSS